MPVVLLLAALAVVAATAVLASGRGGELREPAAEHPPTGLPEDRLPRGADAALLRLPKNLWGYNVAVTDEALGHLAYALTERENRVAELERQIADLTVRGAGEPPLSASWLRRPDAPAEEEAPWKREPETPEKDEGSWQRETQEGDSYWWKRPDQGRS